MGMTVQTLHHNVDAMMVIAIGSLIGPSEDMTLEVHNEWLETLSIEFPLVLKNKRFALLDIVCPKLRNITITTYLRLDPLKKEGVTAFLSGTLKYQPFSTCSQLVDEQFSVIRTITITSHHQHHHHHQLFARRTPLA